MPIRLSHVAAICLLGSLAACSDDPSFQAPEELLGDWEQRGQSGSLVGEWSFFDDGTFLFVDDSTSSAERSGTYSVDGDELTLVRNYAGAETMRYYATDEVVLLRALLPVGEVDGLVGTWQGSLLQEWEGAQDLYDNTLTIDEGGLATFTQQIISTPADGAGDESTWVLDGDWTVEDELLVVRKWASYGYSHILDFFYVSGGAIGEQRLSRRPATGG